MLRLSPRLADQLPVEAEVLTPDRLRDLSCESIRALPVMQGNRRLTVGDAFTVDGDASDGRIEGSGDWSRIKRVGEAMTSGTLTIHGNLGMHAGARMTGGTLHIYGNADAWAGAEMTGGLLHIHGSAGDNAGSAYRGAFRGMRGGMLCIDGDAGHELGAYLRRGIIAVGGATGEFTGVGMIAGSIVAARLGPRPGVGMKRGTILVAQGPIDLPPSFRYGCTYEPSFPTLLAKALRAAGFDRFIPAERYERHCGDLLALGKGELLLAVR